MISVCWDLRSSLQRVGNNKNILYHCWIFMNLFYILYIYTICEKKNWNKGCIFYFFKFSRMLCWKNYEIFSWRIMMNIMPIITDLWKKMGFFFKENLFHVNVHYFHYYIVIKRRNILTIRSTHSCIFVLQESSQSKARSEVTVLLQWEIKKMIRYDWSKRGFIKHPRISPPFFVLAYLDIFF